MNVEEQTSSNGYTAGWAATNRHCESRRVADIDVLGVMTVVKSIQHPSELGQAYGFHLSGV